MVSSCRTLRLYRKQVRLVPSVHRWAAVGGVPQVTCCLLCAEDACVELSRAIEAGDVQSSSVFAAALARQRAALNIRLSAKGCEDSEVR